MPFPHQIEKSRPMYKKKRNISQCDFISHYLNLMTYSCDNFSDNCNYIHNNYLYNENLILSGVNSI